MKRLFEIKYAGLPVIYKLRNKKTSQFFTGFIHLSESDVFDILMTNDEFNFFRKIHSEDISDEYVEYKGLLYLTAKKLLVYNCCIFHAVSFIWKEKAWLLTGKSGIGKTTQYLNWNKFFPNEISMISGDMPVLDFNGNKILVHPSPWNGKERIRGKASAELGGIIFLEQNIQNSIEYNGVNDSIISLFHQFSVFPENEEEICALAKMVQNIIENVPVWIFSNDGSSNSSVLLRKTILECVEKENQIK